ncbi:uncharacterized protein Aud_008693 [Aspergillus udagawae]|uniref:Enoyl reductase (ER) domain-containing protein n=1 Tax=Aspergillus udagawae TaxID=91492 RepID=A0A8E0QXN1_9EURO|nr:uncharacterized protein Aud_008693 [Aspergillus udagawae]GIC92227.1 hypothetical protein Aud_008693 [Aspergillus udagawae]
MPTMQRVEDGPYGGYGGSYYKAEHGQHKIKKIDAWGRSYDGYDVVNGFQFTWDDGYKGPLVGHQNPNIYRPFEFEDDEKITSMTIRAGHDVGFVDAIEFNTNKSRHYEVGGKGGEPNVIKGKHLGNGDWIGAEGRDPIHGADAVVDSIKGHQKPFRPILKKTIVVKGGKGPADAMSIKQIPRPTPSVGQALIKIKAFGLNRMDLLQREGLYPLPPQAPKTMGVEFSGTVESVAAGAETDFKAGAYGGAYAEYIIVDTGMLVHKPPELTWEQAACVPETWITASQALHIIGKFKPGRSVLWHAGASSVSICGIQLAKAEGAKAIYATAGSQEKCGFLVNELGVTAAFNYKSQDWATEVKKVTDGAGVDLIVDFVGANYFQGNLDAAARDGRIVILGLMSGQKLPDGVDIGGLLFKRLRVEGSTLRSRDLEYQRKLRDSMVAHVLPRLMDGTFKVFVEKVFPFTEIVEAHKLLESNQTRGKLACVI